VAGPAQADAFEHHIATPHGLDFGHAAALYGCGYEVADTVTDFQAAVERSLRAEGPTTIIELGTDRARNLELHRRVAAAVREALVR
jgi:2-succinyl-5-enolpyruvyl-6-hydroxy-3-cyclohexene-1-carboxylate synthase